MSAGVVILIVTSGATALLMVVWTLVTMFRIIRPEAPLPLFIDPYEKRRKLTEKGHSVQVGFREIYEDVQRLDPSNLIESGGDGAFRCN